MDYRTRVSQAVADFFPKTERMNKTGTWIQFDFKKYLMLLWSFRTSGTVWKKPIIS